MSVAPFADDSPVDPDDELLVAYLDGELDQRQRGEVEQRLLEHETLRRRLQQLQASWEWLEELPSPTTSEKLVETTLEFVVADLNPASQPKTSLWTRNRWSLITVAACLVAVIAAAGGIILRRHADYQRQLADLEIAEDLQAYLHGADLSLMRELAANPEWNKSIKSAVTVGELDLGEAALVASIPLDQRASAVANLTLNQRTRLEPRWSQFEGLGATAQSDLRRTAAAVAAQPDAVSLLDTMRKFAAWREKLTPAIRDDLAGTDGTKRDAAIRTAITQTLKQATQRSGVLLDDETIDRVYFALREILKRRVNEIIAQLSEDKRPEAIEWFRERMSSSDRERFSIWIMLQGTSNSRGGGAPGGGELELRGELNQGELDLIELILPSHAVEDLEKLSYGERHLKEVALTAWAEEAVRRKYLASRGDEASLLQRYESLDAPTRKRLDLRPPERILDELYPETRRPPRRPGP